MNKRSKRYIDEFKMLILELLEKGRIKKSLEMNMGQQQQEMDKNKKLEKELGQKELDIDILKKASAILMKK